VSAAGNPPVYARCEPKIILSGRPNFDKSTKLWHVRLGSPTPEKIRELVADRLMIEADEPPILRVLDSVVYNELCKALGVEECEMVNWLVSKPDVSDRRSLAVEDQKAAACCGVYPFATFVSGVKPAELLSLRLVAVKKLSCARPLEQLGLPQPLC
jgi:hypothetical protein